MHDAVADDDGGGDERPGAVVVQARWVGGRLWDPLDLRLRHQLWEGDHRRWGCVLGMSGVWSDVGCGGSFHPGAPMETVEVRGLAWRGGDGGARDGEVSTDGHVGASLVGYKWEEGKFYTVARKVTSFS